MDEVGKKLVVTENLDMTNTCAGLHIDPCWRSSGAQYTTLQKHIVHGQV
jgi:hypothetical protein